MKRDAKFNLVGTRLLYRAEFWGGKFNPSRFLHFGLKYVLEKVG
jgi:hypothetical protein